MHKIAIRLLCCLLLSSGLALSQTPDPRYARAIEELTAAKGSDDRFYALGDAAMESFNVGKIEDARKYAEELMLLAPKFRTNFNYGNAVHKSNLVLGRIAVREGRIDDAKRYLLESGKTPGSPQLNSFGPKMSLAKDLLEKGEREVVVQYFELCRKFWTLGEVRLNLWAKEVKDGRIPDFGANLGD